MSAAESGSTPTKAVNDAPPRTRATLTVDVTKKARFRAHTAGREFVSAWNQRSTTSTGRKMRLIE